MLRQYVVGRGNWSGPGFAALLTAVMALPACSRDTDDAAEEPSQKVAQPGPSSRTVSRPAGRLPAPNPYSVQGPAGFTPAGYVHYDRETGRCSLRANGAVLVWGLKLTQPRQFVFLELWRFEPKTWQWSRLTKPGRGEAQMRVDKRTAYGKTTDQVLVHLTDRIGLYWAKWLEDGKPIQGPVYCGPVMPNDLHMAPPPAGMIVAAVPSEHSARTAYVPDPRIHCHPQQ